MQALAHLAAFALVAEEFEQSGDAVKGLRPLFASVLSKYAGSPFSEGEFASSFSELFGISMAPHVAKSLAPKLAEINLLVREGVRYVVSSELSSFVPSSVIYEELPQLLSAFSSWASTQVSQKGFEFSKDELESEFQARLSRPEFAAGFFDEDDTARAARLKAQIFSDTALLGREREVMFDFLVAKFITFANAHAPELFDAMARVSSGALIAEAIAGLASPGEIRVPKEGFRIVIDGPLLLDYLDLNTPEQHVYVKQMLKELQGLGFALVTFDHVIDEMRSLINAALKEYAVGREYGPLGDRLRSEVGFTTYAALARDAMERRLQDELGLVVLRYELYDQGDRDKYFSDQQFDSLRNSLGDLHHQFERRERDAKSITGVIRLKKENRRPDNVFGSGTVFLTRNSRLCKDATRFLSIGRGDPDPRYAVVLDSQLLPIIWFSQGAAEKFEKMSRERLIANCAAAMVPQREVVHKIADYLTQINPKMKEEFSALMADDRAKLCPMRFTLGVASTIDDQSARELLEEMRASLTEPVIEEARATEARYKEIVGTLEGEASRARDSILVMQETVSRFDADLAQAILDRDRQAAIAVESKKSVEGIASGKEREAAKLLHACDEISARIRKWVAFGLWLLVAASSLYSLISGDQRGYVAVAGTLVGALLFGTGQVWADAFIDRVLVAVLMGRRRAAAHLLREAEELRNSVS